ncbi:tear acid lipase-like protein isoform X1 [Cricetulus griseus]|uniref:tear acid lipase-like protein isoform X1 n=1 Tax=Cricetulus griseus TaxID=10029 RepID=UPI0004544207|nr:tear acid lipase-like protein isoform X1 [Cricetulus griseus]
MWWLLKTICLVHVIGNILCLLKPKPKNPEANMNVSEIISYWGYKWEVYEVVSGDGYILPIYRIPRGKNEIMDSSPKTVVYLQHGLTLSASSWILNPPSSSLGFLLADANFDVWLGNSRGNNYAMKHVYLDPNCKAFWDFSFDEQIKFDIPAIIDFIVNKTGQKQIYYVGHSQGTLLAYGAFATNPQLAQKIKANLALTPVVTTRYLSGAFRTIAYVHPTVIKVAITIGRCVLTDGRLAGAVLSTTSLHLPHLLLFVYRNPLRTPMNSVACGPGQVPITSETPAPPVSHQGQPWSMQRGVHENTEKWKQWRAELILEERCRTEGTVCLPGSAFSHAARQETTKWAS